MNNEFDIDNPQVGQRLDNKATYIGIVDSSHIFVADAQYRNIKQYSNQTLDNGLPNIKPQINSQGTYIIDEAIDDEDRQSMLDDTFTSTYNTDYVLNTYINDEPNIVINGIENNSITLDKGSEVNYKVELTGFETISDKLVLNDNMSLDLSLTPKKCKFEIVPYPNDAMVIMNGVERREIIEDYGTYVTITIIKDGYETIEWTQQIVNDEKRIVNMKLTPITITLYIVPIQSICMIDGEKVGGSVEIYKGKYCKKVVLKRDKNETSQYQIYTTNYEGEYGTLVFDEDKTIEIDLSYRTVCITFVVNVEATVVVNGEEVVGTKDGDSYIYNAYCKYGDDVSWSAKTEFDRKQGTILNVQKYMTISVNLIMQYSLIIRAKPSWVTCYMNDVQIQGILEDDTMIFKKYFKANSVINYTLSGGNCIPISSYENIVDRDVILDIELHEWVTLTIIPSTKYNDEIVEISDSVVKIERVGDCTQKDNTIVIPNNTLVTYSLRAKGFMPINDKTILVQKDTIIQPIMEKGIIPSFVIIGDTKE